MDCKISCTGFRNRNGSNSFKPDTGIQPNESSSPRSPVTRALGSPRLDSDIKTRGDICRRFACLLKKGHVGIGIK